MQTAIEIFIESTNETRDRLEKQLKEETQLVFLYSCLCSELEMGYSRNRENIMETKKEIKEYEDKIYGLGVI